MIIEWNFGRRRKIVQILQGNQSMPDFKASRGPGEGPMRRPVKGHVGHYGPGGLPSEGVEPAPKPWPIVPWLALVTCVCFLALQLWPATHYRHHDDPSRTWHVFDDETKTLEAVRRTWDPSFEEPLDPLALLKNMKEAKEVTETELSAADSEASDRVKSHEVLRRRNAQDVQIFLSTDEKDLRPLAVVINSTLSNARHPEKIKFNLVIPTSESQLEYYKLTSFFPHTSIEIVSEGIDLEEISNHIKFRNGSKARGDLATPYNFLPFYLPHLLKGKDIDKIIYLDTDAVVKGDIEELYSKSLEGYPVAAVKDCSQRFKIYFDFKQLNEIQAREKDSKPWIPMEPFDKEECVYNRGALVIDIKQWIQQNITEAIEWWMQEYEHSSKVLYKYGLSQPPFLLALYKNYKELEHEWNIRGLGRDQFSTQEQDFVAEVYGHRPDKKPFLSMETDYAKILHFNGKFKPWKRNRVRLPTEGLVSLCGQEGHECYKLWWEYLSPNANDAFKHTTKQP